MVAQGAELGGSCWSALEKGWGAPQDVILLMEDEDQGSGSCLGRPHPWGESVSPVLEPGELGLRNQGCGTCGSCPHGFLLPPGRFGVHMPV